MNNKKIEEALEKLKDKWKKLNVISTNKISKIDGISKQMQDLAEKSERLKNKNISNSDYEDIIKKLKDENHSLNSENEKLKKELKEFKNKDILEIEEKNKNLAIEIENLKQLLKIQDKEIEDLKHLIEELKNKEPLEPVEVIDHTLVNSLNEEITRLKELLNEQIDKLEEEEKKNKELREQQEKNSSQINRLLETIDELNKKYKEIMPTLQTEGSFSEKNYLQKKDDIRKLKNEIQRQKEAIFILII